MGHPESIPSAHVDKLLLPARVILPGLEQLVGSFALLPASPFRDGPESLLELLNSPVRVVPIIRESDDAVLLISRLAIDWVEVSSQVEPELIRPRSFLVTREEHVQVRLMNGRLVEGRVTMELPDHLNRVSDFLNMPEDFFPLATRSCIMLFNKSHIAGARLFHTSPRPPVDTEEHDAA